ncbi:ATP-binding cassette domain-containing protein [Bacillus aquiflavi]|uniref:ATP-binding cassette domain-containing protein n=1 Tax=Bacillus aquiflavi TaxID=2672567 RepID=A0A6B3W2U1_9BACI|nr:ATP-binding cassette domain-containing protein [Bacillus aquiflavi]NEY81834.1 ATP-binding cassette domain-containing protein [Bacillus aquiflavi]UAC50102.1 ATP-binding cassette domain-containing protein [Bacillus aquiflavi]
MEVNQLNKRFGIKKVLNHLNLHINECCVTAILGNNGAGKSVFLNYLLNFLDYDSGRN